MGVGSVLCFSLCWKHCKVKCSELIIQLETGEELRKYHQAGHLGDPEEYN